MPSVRVAGTRSMGYELLASDINRTARRTSKNATALARLPWSRAFATRSVAGPVGEGHDSLPVGADCSSRVPGISVATIDTGSLAGNVAIRASFSASSTTLSCCGGLSRLAWVMRLLIMIALLKARITAQVSVLFWGEAMAFIASTECANAAPARISAATQIASISSCGVAPWRKAALVCPWMQWGH